MTITPAWENYLKTILELSIQNGEARVTDISARLGVTKATVSQTVKKMMDYGLTEKSLYGSVFLTDAGKAKAMEVQNRNAVIRRFLTDVLGVNRRTSEADACKMEHLVSSETLTKLEEYLTNAERGVFLK